MATEARVLGGRYEVGPVLGYGGMAEVHRGRDVRLGRDVAIKMLRSDLARDPGFQSRFRREVLESEGRLLPHRALEITAQVCAALDQAHRAGIVHRDVKPGNVMLTATGAVKVMDFGIARAVTGAGATMTQTAAVIGTAHYLSPEQARGEHVDARSDVYSTGCLLYELLTGGPPFSGDSAVAVAYQHVREDPVPPSQVEPDVSPAVDAIVLKALAKNPANRYQTAGEMRADIERALAGQPVQATPVLADESAVIMPAAATTVLLRQPPQRHGGRGAAYTLLALATIAVFLIALLIAKGLLSGGTSEVNTPRVIGLTLQDAEATLAAKGLAVGTISYVYNPKPKGIVIDQDPTADILLKRGDTVDLTVSRGVHIVQVPSVAGLPQDQAVQQLKLTGLKPVVVSRNSDAPVGQVLGTDPQPGAQVPEGSSVTLYVSNAQVKVPNVVGRDTGTAEALLEQAGFTVAEKPAAVYDPSRAQNIVLSQSPTAGTYAKTQSTITIFVNTKPSPSPTPTSASPSPSASTSPSTSPSASTSPTP